MTQPAESSLPLPVVIYFAATVLMALVTFFHMRSLPSAASKRLWWKRYSIGGPIAWLFLMVFVVASTGSRNFVIPMIFLCVPFVALISWLNIRNTYFCENCGKRTTSRNPFVRLVYCPRCGAKFEDTSRMVSRLTGQ